MAERALRGSNLGSTSYENDRGVELAPRRTETYDCPAGHLVTVPFSVEADPPPTWECRTCGATAILRDAGEPEPKRGKPQRTHWDMLLERRSVDDLEVVLAERLQKLRSSGGVKAGGPVDHRSTARQTPDRKSA